MFDGLFAMFHLVKRDYATTAAFGRAVTQLNASYSAGYKPYLSALGHLGDKNEAATVLRRLRSIEPGISVARCLSAFPLEVQVDRDHFAEGLRLAGMS
jgi:hypothetical protein